MFLVYTFGIKLAIFEIIIISSFASLHPLLPVCGFGSFGTTEATLTIVMILFGVVKDLAIAASFGVHIFGLVYVFLLGGYGAWKLSLKYHK